MRIKEYIAKWLIGGMMTSKSLGASFSTGDLKKVKQVFYEIGFNKYTYAERNFEEFVEEGYGRNPYVFMCVEKIADVGGDYEVIFTDLDGEEMDVNGDVSKILNSPAFKSFAKKAVKSWCVSGNAVIYETTGIGSETPDELDVAIIQDVTVFTDRGNEIQGKPVAYDIEYVGVIESERVLHWKRENILRNTFWGVSPLYAGQTLYEGSNNTFKASASIHKNSGATGIISSASEQLPLSPNERKEMQTQFNLDTAGPEKAGMKYVASAPISYTQIGMSAEDMELVKFNIEHLRNICSLYNLDSSIFNDPANKTYNNRKEAETAMHTNAVLPVWKEFYEVLSKWWIQEKLGIEGKITINTSKIQALQESENERHARVVSDLNSGILTPDEARYMLYPELESIQAVQTSGTGDDLEGNAEAERINQ